MPSTPLGQIGAGLGMKSLYRPSKGYIKDYENWQHGDIGRLRGPNPYAGKDLGFDQATLEGKMAQGTDESAAEYKTNLSTIEGEAARGGSGMRSASGAYYRAKGRALAGHLARTADTRRTNLILDAYQRRQDMAFRMGQQSDAYKQGTSLYNAHQQQASARASAIYGGIGDAVSYAAMGA